MNMEIEGFNELQGLIDQLGKVPQKVATKAARAGANVLLRDVKQKAPYDTGLLKSALKNVGERNKPKGKKVYEVTFDKQLSGDGKNGLVKISEHTNKRAYYPASQEFGWTNMNGKYVPGFHYMKDTAMADASTVENKIVDVAKTEIDKILSQAR
jgi:hypothetical protein